MQFAHIVPIQNLQSIKLQKYNMFLTHLVERSDYYMKFAKEIKGFKMLDNSLIELGASVSLNRVVDAAYAIEANEIVLPDKLLDCQVTLQRVEHALVELGDTSKYPFKLMAVVHGSTPEEWFKCFEELNKIEEITTLGIPKILTTIHADGRPHFINNLPKTKKEIHLLGVWDTLSEFLYMKPEKRSIIRGVDSSLPAVLAIQGDYVKPIMASRNYYSYHSKSIDLECDQVIPEHLNHVIMEVNNHVDRMS